MAPERLTDLLKQRARGLGFDLAGACPAVAPEGIGRLREWLSAGYAGQMRYIGQRLEAYEHPRHVLDGVRSLLMLGWNYRSAEPHAAEAGQGRVSRYAWGSADYHDVIHERLQQLVQFLRQQVPQALARGVVDTAPLLEREFAQLAGLGWIGKNTLLINRRAGSWFFLAALLTDCPLDYDPPHEADHCGTCRACLDACPTAAFPASGVLDATRCISYLTIELRDPVPGDLRAGLGDWLFGCDVCQDVCPWNRKAPVSDRPGGWPAAGMNPVDLVPLFALSEEDFRRRFRNTPLWRAKRRGVLRNAALVLGNQRPPEALHALVGGLQDAEPLVRGACVWALAQYGDELARAALVQRLAGEPDAAVRDEIVRGLGEVELSCDRNFGFR